MKKIFAKSGYEVWSQYDSSSQVYELFTDKDGVGYVGCADTPAEALEVAEDWVQQREEE
jgi:hypothetical protein